MDSSTTTAGGLESAPEAPHQDPPNHSRALQVDFSWRKFNTVVTEKDDPDSKPVYIVGFNTLHSRIVFKSAADDSQFGTGNLHAISINTNGEIHGKNYQLKALKRFKTSYMHLSHAYSDSDTPVPMTWTSSANFTQWDFVCLDEQQNPVAKFSANIWGLKNLGNIEFLGPRAGNAAAREEILVVGMTLYYTMLVRTSSVLSLFGAAFSNPGPIKQHETKNGQEQIK
ncbi:hypothetical protein DL98DRAFT_450339 [Cadophora sp. DSE1049]|nr:hypothetical protein DL98DRAFT_450339 [Cadophora sp. DSE1049]